MTTHSRRGPAIGSGLHLVLVCLLALLPMGCGDDGDGGTGSTVSDRQRFESGMEELGSVAASVGEEPGLGLLNDPRMSELMGMILPPDAAGGLGMIAVDSPTSARAMLAELATHLRRKAPAMAGIEQAFGSYDFDALDQSMPFPGWVLVNPELPKDGFIFRFGPEDEFRVPGPEGEPILVQGELRMLGLQIDDRGTPELAEDDLVEHVVLELAIAPAPFPPLTVIRLDITMHYGLAGEPVAIKLGDATAADRTDPRASFITDTLIAVELSAREGNIDALVQIYSLPESYVLRLRVSIAGLDATTEVFDSTTLDFGFGRTTTPARPPWIFAVKLSDPLTDTQTGSTVYAVDGTVTLRGGIIATMMGNTSEIQLDVDVNGDQVVDAGDTCIDVDVIFSDDPGNSQNLCVVMHELWVLFSSGMSKTIGAVP